MENESKHTIKLDINLLEDKFNVLERQILSYYLIFTYIFKNRAENVCCLEPWLSYTSWEKWTKNPANYCENLEEGHQKCHSVQNTVIHNAKKFCEKFI